MMINVLLNHAEGQNIFQLFLLKAVNYTSFLHSCLRRAHAN
jgi:hypothetical protein